MIDGNIALNMREVKSIDLGTQYLIRDNSNLGLSVRNIVTKIKYIDEEENLPALISKKRDALNEIRYTFAKQIHPAQCFSRL